ncbi:MAG: stage III sporulation protein AB [Peptococcaceae bacterium]|nr:stage III sporulation protein AB [Peptococcaceae bacterium]
MALIRYAVIIIGLGWLGLWRASTIRKRLKQLELFEHALSLLDTEIFWGMTPLPVAFRRLQRIGFPWGNFFLSVAEGLEAGGQIEETWREVVAAQKSYFCLTAEDWELVNRLGGCAGRSDRHEQHKQLMLIRNQIQGTEETQRVDAERQARMWSYFGFLGGIAVVIAIL